MIKIKNYSESQLSEYLQQYNESKLKLNINDIKGQEESYLQAIEDSLGNLINLKELEILIKKNCILSETGYALISNTIKKLVNLTKLKITIEDLCFLENSGLIALTNAILSLSELKELEFRIGISNYVDSQSLKYFISSIKVLKNLIKLQLVSQDIVNKIEEQNVFIWSELYHLQQQLEEFTISLNFLNFSEQGFIELLNQIILLKNLQRLEFILTKNDTGTFWIDQFIYSLSQLQKLKTLIVAFDTDQQLIFKKSQIKQFFQNISELKLLEQLDLTNIQDQLLEEDTEQYIKFIGGLKNLTNLKLNIQDYFINTKDHQIIIGESLKQLSKLKNLDLQLGKVEFRFYNEFIIDLSDAFKNMSNLNQLRLNLVSYISQLGYKMLGESLVHLSSLEDLEILFENHNKVTDRSLFLFNIRLLRQLKNLTIKIFEEINHFNCGELFDSVQYLINLESLHLQHGRDFNGTQGFANINILSSSLKHLTNLNKLQLNLQLKNLNDQKSINEFIESIQSLKNLNQLIISLQTGYAQQQQFEIVNCLQYLVNLKILKINLQLMAYYKTQGFTKSITNLKNIESLSISIKGLISSSEFVEIFLALKQSTKLKYLDLSITQLFENPQNELFSEACFNLKHLQVLRISDKKQMSFKEDPLIFYASGLKQLVNLNKIYLISNQGKLTNRGLVKLGQALKNQQNLRVLSLDLNCNSKTSLKGEIFLSKKIKKLKKLKKIKFHINSVDMLGNEIFSRSLGSNMLNKISITSIQENSLFQGEPDYNFLVYEFSDDESFDSLYSEFYEDILNEGRSQVTQIILYYIIYENNSDFLTDLNQPLCQIDNLSYLSRMNLLFESFRLNILHLKLDQQIDFSKLNKLNSLQIYTKNIVIEKSTIEQFYEGFKHTYNIEYLYLNIFEPFDSDYLLMEGISNLKNLKQIEIQICLSDKGAICLGNSLIHFKCLNSCFIEIYQIQDFSQEGLFSVENGLSRLQNLNSLTFYLNGLNTYFKNNLTPQLGKFLNNMKKLNYLSLKIGKNNYCNSFGGIEVMKSIQLLENLINLNLDIEENNQIDSENVSDFLEYLSELKNLKEIKLQIIQQPNQIILKNKFASIFNNQSKNDTLKLKFKKNSINFKFLDYTIKIISQQKNEIEIVDFDFFKTINNKIPIQLTLQHNFNRQSGLYTTITQLNATSIHIKFKQYISEDIYQKFCEVISCWQNTQVLIIECQISLQNKDNNTFELISKKLSELKQLRILKLGIFTQEYVSLNQYINAMNILSQLQQLHEIALDSKNLMINSQIKCQLQKRFIKVVILNNALPSGKK